MLQLGNGDGYQQKTLNFDPKSKRAILDIATLDRTVKLEDANGKLPRVTPVEHVTLINTVISTVSTLTGMTPKSPEIYIDEDYCRRIQWKGDKVMCPVENYIINRLVTKVEFVSDPLFEGIADAEGTMAIGISYTEKAGIQISYGHNVWACSNMNIFGEFIWSTTGNDRYKVDYQKGMQLLYSWLQNYELSRNLVKQRIERLMNVPITEDKRLQIIGKLFESAVRFNSKDKTVDAPLNQTECAELIRSGYSQLLDNGPVTAWDVTNWATNVLKPERSDMSSMLISNHKVNEFICKEVGII